MTTQVMADESGPGSEKLLVIAGLINEAEKWALFSDDWDGCLKESPHLDYFKMREAARPVPSGAFWGFSAEQRDRKLERLAGIINKYAPQVLHVRLATDAYAAIAGENTVIHAKPYFFAFHLFVQSATYEMVSRKTTERFELIFDKQLSLGNRTREWYPVTRSFARPEVQAIMPVEPRFEDDKDFLPLQAADMLAWLSRREGSSEPHSFKWLFPILEDVKISRFSEHIDHTALAQLEAETKGQPERMTPEFALALEKLARELRK